MENENEKIVDISKYSGPLIAPLTNDYLFRAYMQSDQKALKGLVCSLLKLNPDDIWKLEITNPIILGNTLPSKDFHLDLMLLLNDNTIINIEMQVINERNWPERSLSYLCRNFDNISSGDDYIDVRPAIHIGILDFTLFEDHPEFYATFKMLNTKSFFPYTEKFTLHVLDLTKIILATKEDIKYGLHTWARLFKATTWEEINMLAAQNEFMNNTGVFIAKLTDEERTRQAIEAREKALRIRRTQERSLAMAQEELKNAKAALADKDATIASIGSELSKKEAEIENLKQIIQLLEKGD